MTIYKVKTLLSAIIVLLLFNGCMTMGWGGHGNNMRSQPAENQSNLIKEHQVENQTVRATFPSAAAGQEVRFELETISLDTAGLPIESTILEIKKTGITGSTLTTTTIEPDPTLSRPGYWIFPYSFHEPGSYEIAFRIQFGSHKQPSSPLIISDLREVSEPATTYNGYSPFPWIAGGVIMTGFMIWMMAN